MKRALYFDCFSGVSGDMTFGALLDLGLDSQIVFAELEKLGLKEYDIHAVKTEKYAISGTDLTVTLHEKQTGEGHSDEPCAERRHDHFDHHRHAHPGHHHHEHHGYDDAPGGGHHHAPGHGHHHAPVAGAEGGEHHGQSHRHGERNLHDIMQMIRQSGLSERVKQLSEDIFTEIAAAEARVHGKTIEEVHFHEVGAVDSIVDIVGVAICVDLLAVDDFYCSVLQEGCGFVECRHGKLPVPVPAVMEMLGGSGMALQCGHAQGELITPTGMGIVKILAGRSGPMPAMKIIKTGYGFGKRDTGSLNGLRLVLGERYEEAKSASYDTDIISEIKTNLDDMTGEEIGFLTELLFEKGALDVFCTAVQMKKNRPGILLSVLSDTESENEMADILLRHSTAIGVRMARTQRMKLYREIRQVKTCYGEIRVKKTWSADGKIVRFAPEYEDCKSAAKEHGVPVKKIFETVKKAIDE